MSLTEKKTNDVVLYTTYTICARCVLIDKKGLLWKDAAVVRRGDHVWLTLKCKSHGIQETLYCADAEFFERMLRFNPETVFKEQLPDIEDLRNMMNYGKTTNNFPLIMELSIWENNVGFLPKPQIEAELLKYKSFFPPAKKFVLKVCGKTTKDLETCNSMIEWIASLVPENPIMVELSFERLIILSRLQGSVFFNPRIFPAVKYTLQPGDEDLCCDELSQLFAHLQTYSGVQLVVTIGMDRPFAKLDKVLALLRSQVRFVRFIIIGTERSPRQLMQSLASDSKEPKDLRNSEWNNDPYELLKHIQEASGHTILLDDFFPASIGMALEPLLSVLGYGNFNIRPSPFCAFATCLVNTAKISSFPVNRLLNIEKFFHDIRPILPKLQTSGFGLFTAGKVKKILKESEIPGKPLPDIFSYLTDKAKAEDTRKFISQLQFLVIHNNMDIGAIDMVRRCNCPSVTHSPLTPNGVIATCTSCI